MEKRGLERTTLVGSLDNIMLIDQYGREINYLRVSVTQKCNLRCHYCMPNIPFDHDFNEKLLSFDEMMLFIKVAIDRGVNKIRITGGEPLLRRDLHIFIKMIKDYSSTTKVHLTTNGVLLSKHLNKLKEAGLDSINISLDTLNSEAFYKITQKNLHDTVLKAIDNAKRLGINVKLNTVVMRGFNEGDILELVDFAKDKNIVIRFIEFMENKFANKNLTLLDSQYILDQVSKKYTIGEQKISGNSPAKYYDIGDGYQFGIIDPHGEDFCERCNRLRVTAEGDLISCLFFDDGYTLSKAIKESSASKISEVLDRVLANKHLKNNWASGDENEISDRAFNKTGG